MRLGFLIIIIAATTSCTRHQITNDSIAESNRILNERAEGAKKITEARANSNVHGIMELDIPKVNKKNQSKKSTPDISKSTVKEVPDIFEVRPSGMIKEVSDE